MTTQDPLLDRPFRFYIRRHWRPFALGSISLFFTNALEGITPLFIGKAIDLIIGARPFAEVRSMVFIILAVTTFLALFRFMWRYFWGRFHHTVAEHLRHRVFAQFTRLGPAFFQRNPTGQLMSLVNNDVNTFRMAIGPGLLVLFDSIILLAIVPPLMWSISPNWVWKSLILMPLVPFVMARLLKISQKAYKDQQDRFSEMAGAAQEIVSGIRVIKSYAQEDNQTRVFNRYSRRYADSGLKVAKVDASFTPSLEIGAAFGSVILLIVGAPAVMSGQVTLGQFFAFYQYIQRMLWPMEALGIFFSQYQMGRAAFARISDLLSTQPDTPDRGTVVIEKWKKLEVKDLTFAYPGQTKPVLKNISFGLAAGEVLGVVGTTGSGKSTLADVLCHLYPVTPNSVFINGHPMESISRSNLHQMIAFAPQDCFLFSRRLSENIAFGIKDWTFSEIKTAAELVRLDTEIESWPEQYDTLIGERGVNLSGGQRQRLTIARALARKAPLMILDDSLSAVDAKTEASILKSLRESLTGTRKTAAIIISHRLASVKWADRILVLKHGAMEALGTHGELMKTSETYQQLYALQSEGAT